MSNKKYYKRIKNNFWYTENKNFIDGGCNPIRYVCCLYASDAIKLDLFNVADELVNDYVVAMGEVQHYILSVIPTVNTFWESITKTMEHFKDNELHMFGIWKYIESLRKCQTEDERKEVLKMIYSAIRFDFFNVQDNKQFTVKEYFGAMREVQSYIRSTYLTTNDIKLSFSKAIEHFKYSELHQVAISKYFEIFLIGAEYAKYIEKMQSMDGVSVYHIDNNTNLETILDDLLE